MRLWQVVFVVLFLFNCGGGKTPKARVVANSKTDSTEVWLATYLMDKKVGYAVSRYLRLDDGYRFDNLTQMTVGMMGKTQMVNVRSRVFTNPDLTLRSFIFEMGSQDGLFKAGGEVKDGWLIFNNGRHRIKLTRPLYPLDALGKVIVNAKPEPGTVLNYLTFDGTVLDTMPTTVEVLGKDTFQADNRIDTVLKVNVKRASFSVTVWLDRYGMTLREESPLGISSYRVSEEAALAGHQNYSVDVLRVFAVPVDTQISEPDRVRRVVLEVFGIESDEITFTDANQRVISTQPLRMEIVVPDIPRTVKLPIGEEHDYLKATMLIQSDAGEIKRRVQMITRGNDDAVVVSKAIMEWAFTSLKKEPVASMPNALAVLESMKGDCNEHSVLYAALARAAGIPTKVVAGLVYLDGAFYYHAWNEIYLGRWIPIDATFGEFPANALHLKLVEGELSKQAEILGVVRRIGIRIVEYNLN